MMSILIQTLLFLLPWSLRRRALVIVFRFEIHPTAYVGYSWINSGSVMLAPFSRIGHFTIVKGARLLQIGQHARIGNLNWITGTPLNSSFFSESSSRDPSLTLGDHSAITHRHLIDCTDAVKIGAFTTFAGWGSQILTHSIDVETSRQTAAPVEIGEYSFIGTRVVILKGGELPSFSVLGAGAVLTDRYTEEFLLYGGVPAKPVSKLSPHHRYFERKRGFID